MAQYERIDEDDAIKRQMSSMGAAFIRGTWDPGMNMIEPTINGLWFFERAPQKAAIIRLFETHIWPNYRFHSCMSEDGKWVALHRKMDSDYHFPEVSVPDEAAIDEFVQNMMAQPLDKDYPAWRMYILRAPANCRSAILFRLHHCIGDGLGLVFAFSPHLGCEGGNILDKIPLPKVMLPKSKQKQGEASPKAAKKKKVSCLRGILTTFCCGCMAVCRFLRGAAVVVTAKHDSELVLNAPLAERTPFLPFNGRRVHTRFPPLRMSTIKAITQKHGCSVNDVLMTVLTGALRKYGGEVCGDERLQRDDEDVEFKSMVMIALPRDIDENDMMTALCNNILFASCPLPIDEPTPQGRMRRVVDSFNNLKSKAYMSGLIMLTNFLKGVIPTSLFRKAASETFSKHSMLVTNVPGPTVPMTFPKEGGEVMGEVHMVFPNVVPQVSFISYNGFIYGNIVADPAYYPDGAKLGELLLAEVQELLAAPVESEDESA